MPIGDRICVGGGGIVWLAGGLAFGAIVVAAIIDGLNGNLSHHLPLSTWIDLAKAGTIFLTLTAISVVATVAGLTMVIYATFSPTLTSS